MVAGALFSYSNNIDTSLLKRDCKMNITLGLRALTLLAFVAASTAVIVAPTLLGGTSAAQVNVLDLIVAINHS